MLEGTSKGQIETYAHFQRTKAQSLRDLPSIPRNLTFQQSKIINYLHELIKKPQVAI